MSDAKRIPICSCADSCTDQGHRADCPVLHRIEQLEAEVAELRGRVESALALEPYQYSSWGMKQGLGDLSSGAKYFDAADVKKALSGNAQGCLICSHAGMEPGDKCAACGRILMEWE